MYISNSHKHISMCICVYFSSSYFICIHIYGHIPWDTQKSYILSPFLPLFSMLQSHRSIVEKENLDYQVGCMENVSAGSKMSTFWMVSEGQPFGENSGHTFFLFCFSILLTSLYPPHAEGVWGQAHLSLLRGDQEHNQSQGKESAGASPHSLQGTKPPPRAYMGVCANPHSAMGGDKFAWKLCPAPAAGETLGSQGTPASPLCYTLQNVALME